MLSVEEHDRLEAKLRPQPCHNKLFSFLSLLQLKLTKKYNCISFDQFSKLIAEENCFAFTVNDSYCSSVTLCTLEGSVELFVE